MWNTIVILNNNLNWTNSFFCHVNFVKFAKNSVKNSKYDKFGQKTIIFGLLYDNSSLKIWQHCIVQTAEVDLGVVRQVDRLQRQRVPFVPSSPHLKGQPLPVWRHQVRHIHGTHCWGSTLPTWSTSHHGTLGSMHPRQVTHSLGTLGSMHPRLVTHSLGTLESMHPRLATHSLGTLGSMHPRQATHSLGTLGSMHPRLLV